MTGPIPPANALSTFQILAKPHLCQLLESQRGQEAFISWQGGEPTLSKFFRKHKILGVLSMDGLRRMSMAGSPESQMVN